MKTKVALKHNNIIHAGIVMKMVVMGVIKDQKYKGIIE